MQFCAIEQFHSLQFRQKPGICAGDADRRCLVQPLVDINSAKRFKVRAEADLRGASDASLSD
jgi:hypothetical protein